MRQTTGLTSTYSSDEFGICSALYELGGMVVMHDASGCNSTYTTHDEPRWYDMDSMIFISAISEMEAIMGDDGKFINDLTETALELKPKFIALVGAPIPYMIGTDLDAIAAIVSERTGIPGFAFPANGMHDYTRGVSMALERIADRYAAEGDMHNPDRGGEKRADADDEITVNIIGATPLDFSLNGSVDSIRQWVEDSRMKAGVCLSMGCTLEEIRRMGTASVNLVVSSGGLAAAKLLWKRFGTPYVAGVPFGKKYAAHLAERVKKTAASGMREIPGQTISPCGGGSESSIGKRRTLSVIGEPVLSVSLAKAIEMECGIGTRVLCPLETGTELLRACDARTPEEDDLIREIRHSDGVIADPLYRPLAGEKTFYPLPHEAFSGRIYDSVNPDLIARALCAEQSVVSSR
ncbi:MAG: nitrogenase component 1 [Clostridiales bacterium]|nr:nitrogenase component 1 [Clostridiales bacterium]